MIEYLNTLDVKCFYFINSSLSNLVFDYLMPFLTDLNKQKMVLAFIIALLIWMIFRGNRNVRIAALCLIITIIISDQLSSSIIKYLFERPRPCRALTNVHLLVSCGSGYSFPSSHAVNNFAGALILAYFIPRYKWWFFAFASIIAFSRVYVGVHYPSDVIGGSVIGLLCGGLVITLFILSEYTWYYFLKKRKQDKIEAK
jgi:undecaprenyl-diphosphatase